MRTIFLRISIGCSRGPNSGPVFISRARREFHPMSVKQLGFKDPTDFGDARTKLGSDARAFLLVNDPKSAWRSFSLWSRGHFCPQSLQKEKTFWSTSGLASVWCFKMYMLLADSPERFSVVPAQYTAREPHRCARTFQSTCREHGE